MKMKGKMKIKIKQPQLKYFEDLIYALKELKYNMKYNMLYYFYNVCLNHVSLKKEE